MGGSLRNPASFCNVVGLRPTPGRVPTWPSALPWATLAVQGPMARTVDDVALLLSVLAWPDRAARPRWSNRGRRSPRPWTARSPGCGWRGRRTSAGRCRWTPQSGRCRPQPRSRSPSWVPRWWRTVRIPPAPTRCSAPCGHGSSCTSTGRCWTRTPGRT
ncbi:MAG: amidase family protein [Sciscionella sp.]